jgi:hypothetical protein
LVYDLSIAHDRFGSSSHVQQNGALSHPQDLDGPLRVAAQRRSMPMGNNTLTIRTFLFFPRLLALAAACTASFCVFFFLQAHWETGAHFTAAGMNVIAKLPLGLVPFQARGILSVT